MPQDTGDTGWGRLVLPGFQDAHVHLMDGGVDLVQSAALWDAGFGPMIIGAGWQPCTFTDATLTRAVLDEAVPDRPCIDFDSSFHDACLNSRACDMVGLTPGLPDPPNRHFVRDATGLPTGTLHEDASYWAQARLPKTSAETHIAGLKAGQAHANKHGITGIIDPAIRSHHRAAYAAVEAEGALTLRDTGSATVTPQETPQAALTRLTEWRSAHHSEMFQITSAKFFFDGVLENRSAAMLAPYADAAGGNAPLMFAPAAIAPISPRSMPQGFRSTSIASATSPRARRSTACKPPAPPMAVGHCCTRSRMCKWWTLLTSHALRRLA